MPLSPTSSHRSVRRLRPRRVLRLFGAALVALLAVTSAACVRGENSSSESAKTDDGDGASSLPACPVGAHLDADGVVEVELWHTMVGETQNNLEALVEEYNGRQDKVRILVRSQGTDYDEVLRKYIAGIPSRQLPAIVYVEDTVLRQITDTGTVLPAEACEEADEDFDAPDMVEAVRNYYTAEDVYWPGYPNVSGPVLYYNANHFRQAGLDPDDPPETLEELQEAARALKEAGIGKPLAFLLNSWFIESWVNGAGEDVINMDNGREGLADESAFDNPATREVYTWIKEMVDEGLMDPYSDSESQINHFLAVAQQNSSMVIETSTAATLIKTVLGGGADDFAEEADSIGLDTSGVDLSGIDPVAAPFPGLSEAGKVRVSGGAFYMTNAVSDAEQAGAWDFMKFMWETDSQVAWHLVGSYLPTTDEAATAPEVVDYWETDMAGRLLKVAYDQLQTIDPQRPGPQVGPQSAYDEAIKNSLDRLALQGGSVEATVTRADEEIQDALTRYIEDNG